MQSAQDQLDGIRQLKAKLFEDDQRAMRQGSPLPIAERVRGRIECKNFGLAYRAIVTAPD
jgi:hypothetical protein